MMRKARESENGLGDNIGVRLFRADDEARKRISPSRTPPRDRLDTIRERHRRDPWPDDVDPQVAGGSWIGAAA